MQLKRIQRHNRCLLNRKRDGHAQRFRYNKQVELVVPLRRKGQLNSLREDLLDVNSQ